MERVAVSAQVTDVLDPRHLELAGQDYGEDSLLVRTAQPVEVRQGQVVRATGTVGQYQVFIEEEAYRPCSTTCTGSTRPRPTSTTPRGGPAT